MTTDNSILGYFLNAGPVVKFVILILMAASVLSWTLIIQRLTLLKSRRQDVQLFEDEFWSGGSINKIYQDMSNSKAEVTGIKMIFASGFKEYLRSKKQKQHDNPAAVEAALRSMRIATSREGDTIEANLSVLATIGSTSPYIGLFGTVWGIMTSFHALGNVQQATISMVAPGISEALIATAMGLFAAIPAVIAYNRFSNIANQIMNHYENFQEEFASILQRQDSE